MLSRLSSVALLLAATFGIASSRPSSLALREEANDAACRCFPGDKCWPKQGDWAKLNATVGGRLVATVPLGSPCHDPNYNAEQCAELQDEWRFSSVHMESSSSVMAPLFANESCDPFEARERPCTLGNYVRYAVDVATPEHIAAALQFANKHNIRIVVRNTGHDYNGRSTGAGALAIWTHHLKSSQVLTWKDRHYTGKAIKFGAGIQGFEGLAAAREKGLVVVTGECPSVGLAGGYTQGGGHSALSTVYGLAADNTLSFEVVTAAGKVLTASRDKNADLYWALSGGGGGNYGIVYSMTVRAHPEAKVSGARFAIAPPENNPEVIYDVIDAFHAALPDIVDSGIMIIYFFGAGFIQSPAVTAYNKTQAELEAILKPFIDAVADLGITVEPTYTEYGSYYEHYNHYWGPLPAGNIQVGDSVFGGRLMPRKALPSFGQTARQLAKLGVTYIGVGTDVSRFGTKNANAVLPQWRSSIVQVSLTLPWSFDVPFADMVSAQNRITNEIQPIIEAATPGAGAYMNEADFQQPDFQETFYGVNYPKLLQIKKKYDPKQLLYVRTGVGSEGWAQRNDGRLCKAA
ncbi:FAD-linked oxidoreductase ZEB1 [Paramyrothecium foliicola]|nr:FAD-linked oxidoreductase ZEB1 [Paramyrothecium foliicola]